MNYVYFVWITWRRNRSTVGNLSPSSRRSSSPSHPPHWQRRLLGERPASPSRSVSPHPLPISPLVQRRISSGLAVPGPYRVNRGWVTPIVKTSWIEADGFRRSRSLDTGLGDESKMEDNRPVPVDSEDEVLCSTVRPALVPAKERTSRKDRASVSRSKAAQTIVAAIGHATGSGTRKSRRSTVTDDEANEQPPTFVDRCVTKMKTLINKWKWWHDRLT